MPDFCDRFSRLAIPVATYVGVLTAALTVLLHCITPQDLLACQCYWSGPFIKVAHRADLVVRGMVLTYHMHDDIGRPRAMDVRVDEVLRGPVGVRKVSIRGGDGAGCRPEVRHFPIGSEWIFALRDSADGDQQSYSMSKCGEYRLVLQDGVARGLIASAWMEDDPESLGLDQLRALLKLELRGLIPNRPPHLTGKVSAASTWSLDVLRERDGVPDGTVARLSLTPSTTVIDRNGREYSPKTIPPGTPVSLWFPGPLAPFSAPKGEPFPISATVVMVVVEDAR